MKKLHLLSLSILLSSLVTGQVELPEFQMEKAEVEGHIRFLASDALLGRRTGEPGCDLAAHYLAEYYRAYGLDEVDGTENYFQPVTLSATYPPNAGSLKIGKTVYQQGENLLILSGKATNIKKTRTVFAGHGWIDEEKGYDDYQGLDVKGKVVLVLPGTPEGDDNGTVFSSMAKKQAFAVQRGAVALIELYRLGSFPWDFFKSYFGKQSLKLAGPENSISASPDLVYGWIKESTKEEMARMQAANKNYKASLNNSSYREKRVQSQNVIGYIEGTDPVLKEEYLLITAHYDHVGTGKNGNGAYTAKDSIFNGARDNGIGIAALLTAAKSLAAAPPKRSVLILAVTAEEIGLLGSRFYAANPLIPLQNTIFNLNSDGAGYNDKSIISIIGYGRTGTDQMVQEGVKAVGLEIFADPAPGQNLFDRSDNVNFAAKGIPALTFSPGFKSFDAEIAKNYHQVSDEADTLDFNYVLKFCQSFAHTARLLADYGERPFWIAGDKYEKAGKDLYK